MADKKLSEQTQILGAAVENDDIMYVVDVSDTSPSNPNGTSHKIVMTELTTAINDRIVVPGADTEILYNNLGTVTGASNATYDGTNITIAAPSSDFHAATKVYVDSSTTPGGANTELQYNNSSVFAGIPDATTDGTRITVLDPVNTQHVATKNSSETYTDDHTWPNQISGQHQPSGLNSRVLYTFPDFEFIWNGVPSAQWFQIRILAFGDNKSYRLSSEKIGGTYTLHEFDDTTGSTNDLWYLTDNRLSPLASQVFQTGNGSQFQGSINVASSITDYFYQVVFNFMPRVDGGSDLTFMGFQFSTIDVTNLIT